MAPRPCVATRLLLPPLYRPVGCHRLTSFWFGRHQDSRLPPAGQSAAPPRRSRYPGPRMPRPVAARERSGSQPAPQPGCSIRILLAGHSHRGRRQLPGSRRPPVPSRHAGPVVVARARARRRRPHPRPSASAISSAAQLDGFRLGLARCGGVCRGPGPPAVCQSLYLGWPGARAFKTARHIRSIWQHVIPAHGDVIEPTGGRPG